MRIGPLGGTCNCPTGEIFEVGAIDDDCTKMACFGGKSAGCNLNSKFVSDIYLTHENTMAPDLKFTYTTISLGDYVDQPLSLNEFINEDNYILQYCIIDQYKECFEINKELLEYDKHYDINFELSPGQAKLIKAP